MRSLRIRPIPMETGSSGRLKGVASGAGQGRIGQGGTDDLDATRRQLLHLDAAAQQCGSVPVEHEILGPEPDPFAVGDDQRFHARARGQGPLEALDDDAARTGGEGILDEPRQEAAVAVLLSGGLCRKGRGQKQQKGEGGEKPSQNA